MHALRRPHTAAVFLAVVLLSACGAQRADSGRPRIGVAEPGDAPYFAAQVKAMRENADRMGYEVIVTKANWDPALQAEQLRDLMVLDLDALIVTPVDGKAAVSAIAEIRENSGGKLPILNINSPIDPAAGKYLAGFLGPDDFSMGRKSAHLMCKALGGKGNVIVVAGSAGYPPTLGRRAGFDQGLKDNCPDVKIIDNQYADWDPTKATRATNEMLARHKGTVQGVFAMDDASAAGAIGALKAAGFQPGEIKVTGLGAYKSGLDGIAAGWQYGTVQQDPATEGRMAIEAASRLGKHETIPAKTFLPLPEVNPENAKQFSAYF